MCKENKIVQSLDNLVNVPLGIITLIATTELFQVSQTPMAEERITCKTSGRIISDLCLPSQDSDNSIS
jgi:hypothetical protein